MVVVGLTACDNNQSGNLAASGRGDTSHPAERGSPIDELTAACGDGGTTAAGAVIHRNPYLQQVTSTSAMVGWVSVAPVNTERVMLTTTGGSEISATAAVAELGTLRSVGEKQMWASLNDLQPDTIYCYSLDDGSPMSARTGFRTAPDATSTKPIRFLAFGDSGGGGTDQYALRDQMFDFPYELMIHTGDIAYEDGSLQQFEDNVFGVYADLFKNIPFFPAAGNHDYGTDDAAPFRDVFALPGTGGGEWYSYDWGRIHFVALDTEADYETQAAWLDD
ncbi:MAG: metallophosphoesterase family protein, partial [Polyangiales bacterium]